MNEVGDVNAIMTGPPPQKKTPQTTPLSFSLFKHAFSSCLARGSSIGEKSKNN